MRGVRRVVPFVVVAVVQYAASVMGDRWAASQLKDLRERYQLVRSSSTDVDSVGEVELEVQDLIDAGVVLTSVETSAFRVAEYWSYNGRPISLLLFLVSEMMVMVGMGRRIRREAVSSGRSMVVAT